MFRQQCFYHDLATNNNVSIYRVKYTIGFRPDFIDQDRDVCDWCYAYLLKPLDVILELGNLDTIRTRHKRLIYIEPRRSEHSMIAVWKSPTKMDIDLEKMRQKNARLDAKEKESKSTQNKKD